MTLSPHRFNPCSWITLDKYRKVYPKFSVPTADHDEELRTLLSFFTKAAASSNTTTVAPLNSTAAARFRIAADVSPLAAGGPAAQVVTVAPITGKKLRQNAFPFLRKLVYFSELGYGRFVL